MLVFVIGGARSGKSRHALELAESQTGTHTFIATAQAFDEEMEQRIDRHKEERSDKWSALEEPLYLASRIEKFSKYDVILVDCLTLWVSNWLCTVTPKSGLEAWRSERDRFLQTISESSTSIYLVSNETGLGVVPANKLSRDFVDESGWLHQEVASRADHVINMTVGIPNRIKGN